MYNKTLLNKMIKDVKKGKHTSNVAKTKPSIASINAMYANGGPIVDPMGQWAHPGKVTRIPSDRITMQGVPYPVLGIGSNGHQQLMQPGREYSFNGASHVDEYPMMQEGGWLNKYDNISSGNELKKQAEETIARRNTNRPTMSQYTPKPGEQERLEKEKAQRREENSALLNRLAANPHVAKAQDRVVLPAIDLYTLGEGALAARALATPALEAAGEYLTENTALKNAYKLNPYAFKPTEGMLYRGIGEGGMQDALESGVFRAKQNVAPSMQGRFDMSKQFSKAYYSPKFNVADTYGQGYIAEVPSDATTFGMRYSNGKTWSQIAQEDIPIEKGKILKKDWIKGYKEVPQPTSTQQVTRGPINWWEEPGFMKRNPNFNPEAYVNSPVGNPNALRDIPKGMEPRLSKDKNGGIMINDKDMDTMQFGGKPKQQPSGNRQKQIMQLVQAYAQATHGDPNQILQQLQQMQPQQMQQAIQQMSQAVQGSGAQQPQMGQPQPGMANGGSTYADGVWYKNGGDFGGMISPAVDYGVHAQSFAGYMQAGGSIVDYLKSVGKSSDFDSRAQMAQSMGINNYTGSADQNLNLLSQLQSNKNPKSPLPQPKAKQPVTMKPSPYIMAPKTAVPDFYDMPTLPFSQPVKDPRNLESGVVIDKNTNRAHIIKNGKLTKSFPVLTGQSRDGQNENDYPMSYLEAHPESRVTPTGTYMMRPNANIYGQSGFNMDPIPAYGAPAPKAKAIAAHTTYPGDMARRDPLYRGPGDERNASYGCINCRKPDINSLTNQFPQGDTAIIVDSRNGNDRHYLKESYGIQHQFGGATDGAYEYGYGGMYAEGGTNNPGFHALPDYVQHQILSNMAYGGIHINPANKGKFNATKKRTGKSTEELTHSSNPVTRKRAIFAQNAAKWHHEDGGSVVNDYFAQGGIHIDPSKRGTFTAAATKHHMGVQAFASQVLGNKENYSPAMVKKANFARNASKWKHQDGGPVVGHEMEVTPQEAEMLRQQGYQFEIV